MKANGTKMQRSNGVGKKATKKKGLRTLAECETWFEANWDRAMAAAKENTKRLTGRDCL